MGNGDSPPGPGSVNRRRIFVLGTAGLWLVGLAVLAKVSVDRLQFTPEPWDSRPGGALPAEVLSGLQVGQQFAASLPGLYRIEIILDPTADTPPGLVVFHLKSGARAGEDLRTGVLEAHEEGVYAAEFGPLRDSAGQSYYFSLESPDREVAVAYDPTATRAGSSAYRNGQPMAGSLRFRVWHTLRTRDKVTLFLARLTGDRPFPLASKTVQVGLGVAYALALAVLLFKMARLVLREQEGSA